jgi:hypothetical protein
MKNEKNKKLKKRKKGKIKSFVPVGLTSQDKMFSSPNPVSQPHGRLYVLAGKRIGTKGWAFYPASRLPSRDKRLLRGGTIGLFCTSALSMALACKTWYKLVYFKYV